MAWTDTGLKTCILPAVLTLKPLRVKDRKTERQRGEKSAPSTTPCEAWGRPSGTLSGPACLMLCDEGPPASGIRHGPRWALHPGRLVLNPATRGLPKGKPQHRVRGNDSIRPHRVDAWPWPTPPVCPINIFGGNCTEILMKDKIFKIPMSSRN